MMFAAFRQPFLLSIPRLEQIVCQALHPATVLKQYQKQRHTFA
jgi:hypothetical protein